MIAALLLGREGSIGFPGKNLYPILGRPMIVYPLLAALNSKNIDEVYVSTDSPRIKKIVLKYNAYIIDRPDYLCTKEALGEDAYIHGYKYIKNELKKDIELIVLLFCNGVTVLPELIDEGINILRKDRKLDSAISVSVYNMWSPLRARKIGTDGLLHPFVPFETFGDPKKLNCDRESQGDVWFADNSLSIVRPYCLEHIEEGLLPQRWMGQKIYPIKQWGGLDVDFEWQIPHIEFWLKKHGFSKSSTPYHKSLKKYGN